MSTNVQKRTEVVALMPSALTPSVASRVAVHPVTREMGLHAPVSLHRIW